MGLSLRERWAAAPWAPGHTRAGVGLVSVPAPVRDPKTAAPELSFAADLPKWGLAPTVVEDAGPRMQPLASGLRASSQAVDREGRTAFPFTLRTILTSFAWPKDYKTYKGTTRDAPGGPDAGWTREVQGSVDSEDFTYIVTTEALWARQASEATIELAASHESYQLFDICPYLCATDALGDAVGHSSPSNDLALAELSPWDLAVVKHRWSASFATSGSRAMLRDTLAMIDDGPLRYYGRKQVIDYSDGRTHLGPLHASAPCMYRCMDRDWLLVPAEGLPFPAGDFRTKPHDAIGLKQWDASAEYASVYVYDPKNLGYVGRILLPVKSTPEGLGDKLPCIGVDPRSGTLWAPRSEPKPGEPYPAELFGYKLPGPDEFARLATTGSVFSTLPDVDPDARPDEHFAGKLYADSFEASWWTRRDSFPWVVNTYPTLFAKPIGRLRLTNLSGGLPDLNDVGGAVISLSGRIFVAAQYIAGKEELKPVLGFDPLTGREVRRFEFDGLVNRIQGVSISDGMLKVTSSEGLTRHGPWTQYKISALQPVGTEAP